jgi:adenylosuccinate synthase
VDNLTSLYQDIYERGNLRGIDKPLAADPFVGPGVRANSIAVAGGAFGDEGKGRIVDELCKRFTDQGRTPVVYRWNGGANAGHTVMVGEKRIALHQLPAGALHPGVIVILGKGMVIHPGDLLDEMELVRAYLTDSSRVHIDAMAVLALDTHRAFETILSDWESGGRGATGRGISSAYADVLNRHPVRMRDLASPDWEGLLGAHYDLYAALIGGLRGDLASMSVPSLNRGMVEVGSKEVFLRRLGTQAETLIPYIKDVHAFVRQQWGEAGTPFIFEGAQGIGLDPRFGIYPDITASDPTFDGILNSTEGLIPPAQIAVRAGTIKATYTSSVGIRRLPTAMDEALAHRIREDAHEYGATTRRPRDIAWIDIPCLEFFAAVSGMTHLILTHLDIAYPGVPVRVCTHYTDKQGGVVPYRPDQTYLDTVTPHYLDLPTWDGAAVRGARDLGKLPREALQYIAFIAGALNVTPIMGTTGPERDALISWIPEGEG